MECKLSTSQIQLTETVYENFADEKLDTDIIIPDYSLSAMRILKCDVTPCIIGKSVDGDRVTVDGICSICMIYIAEENGAVKSISEESRFTQVFTLRDSVQNPQIKLKLRTSNVVCRLLNPRKANVKCSVGIAIKVWDTATCEVVSEVDCDGIETLFEPYDMCTFVDSCESDFKISGQTDIGSSGAQIADVLKNDAVIQVTETKIINNKVLIKGNAQVCIIYSTGDTKDDVCDITASIPFSHIIDVNGAMEDDFCDVACEVCGLRADIEADDNGENRVFDIEINGTATVDVFRNIKQPLLVDAYSTKYETNTSTNEITVERNTDNMSFTNMFKNEIALDMQDVRIHNIGANAMIQKVSTSGNALKIEGDIHYALFVSNSDECRILEKTVPFQMLKELSYVCDNMRCEARAAAIGNSFTMLSDDKIEIKTEIDFNIIVYARLRIGTVDSIEVDEQQPIDTKKMSPVVLYYADKGERVWDIARKYFTSAQIIKRNNDIDCDVLDENKMLLISYN